MKTSEKILTGLIIVLVAILGINWYLSSRLKDQLSTKESIIASKEAEIIRFRTDNHQLKQEKQSAIVASKEKDQLEEYYKEAIKDLEENHQVKLKNLHSYYSAQITAKGSGQARVDTTYLPGDPIKEDVYPQVWASDDFLNFHGYWGDNGSLYYEYTYTDSLSIAWHWTKKGVWPFKRRDKLFVSFTSSNPDLTLNSAESFLINDTKKLRMTIGPHVGYDPFNGFSLGLSVQYPVIRIRW